MKKLLLFSFAALVIAGACKSKKNASATKPSTNPTDAQLQAVQTKIPATTMADLNAGHTIFYGQCTNCHGAKNVTGYTEDKLKNVMDNMTKKAKLTDVEKDQVWKYALAVNLGAKKGL